MEIPSVPTEIGRASNNIDASGIISIVLSPDDFPRRHENGERSEQKRYEVDYQSRALEMKTSAGYGVGLTSHDQGALSFIARGELLVWGGLLAALVCACIAVRTRSRAQRFVAIMTCAANIAGSVCLAFVLHMTN